MHEGGLLGRACSPAPAEATATAKATAKAGFLWVGGVGPVEGDAASPPPGPGPAAGGCAFGRLRSSASQAKRPHPCKLGRRIHAAHAPSTGPTPPSTVDRDLSERHGVRSRCYATGSDPRFISISDRCVDQGRHLPTAARTTIAVPNSCRNLSEVGRCRIAGCQPHGCGCQASMDGFTASPQSDTAPPTHGMPLWLWLWPLPLPQAGAGLQALPKPSPPMTAVTCRHAPRWRKSES